MIGPFYVNTEARRKAAWGHACQVPFQRVQIGEHSIAVHRSTVPAFQALEQIRARWGYAAPGSDTGAYNCRHIRHDPRLPWSAHAWATALDWNWLQNPAGSKLVTDMPQGMIRELQGLRTKSGAWVFMWGGDWDRNLNTRHSYYDAMHWEVIAHPDDLATGIEGVENPGGESVSLNRGDRSPAVGALQKHLNAWQPAFNLQVDGIYGAGTEAAVKSYQQAAGFEQDGVASALVFAMVATNALRNPETMKRLIGEL